MTQELAIYRSIDDTMTLGKLLAQSGYFADSRDAGQAVVKVLAGAELGFGPIASMTGINIIKGKVTLSANLIAAAIKRSGRYNYRVLKMTDTECEIAFYEGKEAIGVSTFTAKDAANAGLSGDNWRKFPRNMLFARAISNGAKWYCPDLSGGPLYTPDELGAQVDGETGEVIDAPALRIVEQPKPEPPKPSNGAQQQQVQAVTFRNTARPWSADMAIDAIRSQASIDDGKPVDEGLWGALVGTLDSAPFNSQMRHELVDQIFQVQTTKDLNPAQRKAMLKWSKIAKSGPEKSDPWVMDGNAITEYKRIIGGLWIEQPADTNDPDGWQEIEAAGVTDAARF